MNKNILYDQQHIDFLEEIWGDGFLSPGGRDEVARVLNGVQIEGKRILDIGCGGGLLCEPLTRLGAKVVGIDASNKNIKIALSDPMGSSLYSYISNNKLESSGNSITEGIGTARITKNFDKALIDDAFQTNDTEALNIVYDLIEKQKIILGGSSGINIAGAIKLAKKMGPGKTIVTILCDHGKRYASKIFNKEFLKSKNLPIPKWL